MSCKICGAELLRAPAGHYICTDPFCKNGFGPDTHWNEVFALNNAIQIGMPLAALDDGDNEK